MTFGAGISAIDSVISIMQCQCQWHHITKKSCCISILLSRATECSGAIDETLGDHVMLVAMASHDQKVMLCLISMVLS